MPIQSLIDAGSKVWLDGVFPGELEKNRSWGVTGATSNPIIVADIVKQGGIDQQVQRLLDEGQDDETIAWNLTDRLVRDAQKLFLPVWEQTRGNDGYVSFELDPLLEDIELGPPHHERVRRYIDEAKRWSAGHKNRMIKVPATDAGLDALEEIAASGVTINVTLTFSDRQYKTARENIWRGAQRRKDGLKNFKSVYSIFVSRVDVYTAKHVPELSKDAQGKVGLVNVKRIWKMNQDFWRDKNLPLQQEIILASTGKKLDWQAEDYYVQNLAGGDILTNPPETNQAVQKSDKQYSRQIDKLPPPQVVSEIEQKVDQKKMEAKLMEEGLKKFADPQKALLKLISEKRAEMTAAR